MNEVATWILARYTTKIAHCRFRIDKPDEHEYVVYMTEMGNVYTYRLSARTASKEDGTVVVGRIETDETKIARKLHGELFDVKHQSLKLGWKKEDLHAYIRDLAVNGGFARVDSGEEKFGLCYSYITSKRLV